MYCNISRNVPASQWVDFFCICRTVVNCLRNCRPLLQYQHTDVDVDSVFVGYVPVYFCCGFFRKEVHFQLRFTHKFSKASMENWTKQQGFGLRIKLASFIKLDDIDTKNGKCFPIHVFFSEFSKFESSTQIVSKSEMTRLMKSFGLSL